jgi:hypothetical protein
VTEGEQPSRTPRRTAAAEPAPPLQEEPVESPPPRVPLGRVALGLILLAVGLGWLLQSLDVIDVPWDALLPASLIAVGAVLVVGSRTGRHSGLIALGIVLTLVTALAAAVDVPLIGGAGQREITPLTAADLEARYDLAVGQMVIDLSSLQLRSGDRVELEARVGLGELVVELPENIPIEANARASVGEVDVLGQQASGFGPEREFGTCRVGRPLPGGPPPCVVLNLSVGMGEVRVSR